MTPRVRVLVADDQPLIRTGLCGILAAEGADVVGEAADGSEAVALTRELRPDVVLMDLRMPVMDGIEATRAITLDPALADVGVLVLTTFETDESVLASVRAGARGFVGKDADPSSVVAAVRAVARGESLLSGPAMRALGAQVERAASLPGTPGVAVGALPALGRLTVREREIAALVARGMTNEQIAAALSLSRYTVKTHVNRSMVKVGASDRAQLVVAVFASGWHLSADETPSS